MKIIKLVLPVLLLSFFACKEKKQEDAVACLPHELENGLIAFYPFAHGSIADRSIYNRDLSNPTGATSVADRYGNNHCAFAFNNDGGTEQYLTRTNPTFLDGLNAFTVCMWIQPTASTRDAGDYETLLGRGEGIRCPDRTGEWSLGLYDVRKPVFGHNNSVWVSGGNDSMWGYISNNTYAEVAGWHHLVAIRNNDVFKLYLDGTLQDSKTGAGNCGTPYYAQDIGNLFIGKNYTGKLDDILVYNRELSPQEIAALYNLEPCCQ